jgi:ankyrin repeat protein
MPGIAALYNAVADLGFDAEADQTYSPLAYFQNFLASEHGISTENEEESFAWELPTLFHLQQNEESNAIMTHTSEVRARKQAWPFLVTAGAVLGILASPRTQTSTATLAVNAASSLSLITNISIDIQPAVTDMFSGCLLGLGGVVTLSGCLGLFGPLKDFEEGVSWLTYLVQRGSTRQYFWDTMLEKKLEAENALSEEELKAIAKEREKKGGKKDDPKGKGKGGEQLTLALPFEPDDEHPDPNHGPSALVWSALINVGVPDFHASVESSQPLIAAIQGGLSAVAQELIIAGASVGAVDSFHLTALNHSVILGYSEVSSALVLAGSDVNHLDEANNSLMKYSFFAVTSSDELLNVYEHCRGEAGKDDKEGLALWGSRFFVNELIEASVDLNVSDEEKGNFLLHNAIGMGSLGYMLGGVLVTIKSNAHSNDNKISVDVLKAMIDAGAYVNAVNREGVSVLHALCALGDLAAVEFLLKSEAHPNVIDMNGYMPLHYLAAACPEGCLSVAGALLKQGTRRPKYRLPYEDNRTGKSLEEKYAIDAERVLSEVLGQTKCPNIVNLSRMSEMDILQAMTDRSESVVQLAMCGDALADAAHMKCLVSAPRSSIEGRIILLDFLKEKLGKDLFSKALQEQSEVLSAVQAFSLMNMSVNEASSDVVKVFMSNLQDAVLGCTPDVVAASTTSEVSLGLKAAFPDKWTPVHCAILANSLTLLLALFENGVSISVHPYVHFVAGLPSTSSEVLLAVLRAATESVDCDSLLNAPTASQLSPLHTAVACQNVNFIDNALIFDQINLKVVNEATQRSAFFEAVVSGDVLLVKAFITPKSVEFLDVSTQDVNGKTFIDYALDKRDISMIEALSYDFATTFVEKLACVENEGDSSLLMTLELENMDYCEKLGIRPAVVVIEEDIIEPLMVDDDEEEQLDLDASEPLEQENENLEGKVEVEEVVADDVSRAVLTDPVAIAEAQKKLEESNDIMTLVIGILQDANIVAKDGHAHECFYDGHLYQTFCTNSLKAISDEQDGV